MLITGRDKAPLVLSFMCNCITLRLLRGTRTHFDAHTVKLSKFLNCYFFAYVRGGGTVCAQHALNDRLSMFGDENASCGQIRS